MSRWSKLGLVLAVALPLGVLGVSRYVANSLTRAKREKIEDNPSNLGMSYEDVSFPAAGDTPMLRGCCIAAQYRGRS